MALINYDYYKEKENVYNDGEVESKILKYYKDDVSINFDNDDIYYLTNDIRANVINWYPFNKDSDVLEIGCGCGTITKVLCNKCRHVCCVEGSKRRAEITYYRHKNFDNLEVYAGYFQDIKFKNKFDYIVLIGVFEYAKRFFSDKKDPYDFFMKRMLSLLKEDGKIIIAIENRYGIKYWAGASEDHLKEPYIGLEGYENTDICTYGKNEFIKLLSKYSLNNYKFYYPFPDYKLPYIIYTDDRLPTTSEIKKLPLFLYGDKAEFDLTNVMCGLNDNHMLDFFSNSFIIEFGSSAATLSDVSYVKESVNRNYEYEIMTIEEKDNIYKVGLSNKASEHLKKMKNIHDELIKKGINCCSIHEQNNKFYNQKIDGVFISDIISNLFNDKKIDEIKREILNLVEFYKTISVKKKIENKIFDKEYKKETYVLKKSIVDGNCSNIIKNNKGEYIFIDQEWIADCELPMDYLIYFSIIYIYDCNQSLEKYLKKWELFQSLNISQEKIKLYENFEKNFYEKRKVISERRNKLINNCIYNHNNIQCVIYYDTGNSFNEQEKKYYMYNSENGYYYVDVDVPKNTKKVRFDPVILHNENIAFSKILLDDKDFAFDIFDFKKSNNMFIANGSYPYITFNAEKTNFRLKIKLKKLKNSFIVSEMKTENIKLKQQLISTKEEKDNLIDMYESEKNKNIELNNKIDAIYNSRTFKFVSKIRKMVFRWRVKKN